MNRKDLHRIEILRRAGAVKRLHTLDTVDEHRLHRHVYGSMLIAAELCAANNVLIGNIFLALLYHDAPEVYTGDVPAPVKRAEPSLNVILRGMEGEFYSTYDVPVPTLTDTELAIVKASDTLDLAFAMVEERRKGNRSTRLQEVLNNCIIYLEEQRELRGLKEIIDHVRKEWVSYEY